MSSAWTDRVAEALRALPARAGSPHAQPRRDRGELGVGRRMPPQAPPVLPILEWETRRAPLSRGSCGRGCAQSSSRRLTLRACSREMRSPAHSPSGRYVSTLSRMHDKSEVPIAQREDDHGAGPARPDSDPAPVARKVSMPALATAPPLYRPLLRAELRTLMALKRLGVTFGDQREDAPIGGTANHRRNPYLGHVVPERLVPGVFAPPAELVRHVHRYLWTLPRVEGKRVVDVGCGSGYGSLLLSWAAASVIGIDLDPTAIAHARRHYPEVDYREAAADEPLGDEVDLAVCFEVLEHVADPDAVLRAIAGQSRRLLLSMPNPLAVGSHLNPHHVNDWPLSYLKKRLRAAGFTRLRVFHQPLKSFAIRRGGRPWASVWMIDAEAS